MEDGRQFIQQGKEAMELEQDPTGAAPTAAASRKLTTVKKEAKESPPSEATGGGEVAPQTSMEERQGGKV